MVSSRTITLLFAASASWGVSAGLCQLSATSTSAVETTSTTATTTAQATEITHAVIFRPRNVRRDEEEEFDMPVLSMGVNVSIEEDVEHANHGEHYVLVELDRDDEEMPSIEETITKEIQTSEPATLSYSWALAEGEILGDQGTCSIISKVDGIVVDTLEIHSTPAYVYHDHEFEIPVLSANPVVAMDFLCSGVDYTHANILIDDVDLAILVVKEELRRSALGADV